MFNDLVTSILGVADDVQQEYYQRALGELATYFNGQPVVRCFVTNTNGFGHQVSTVNMMKSLIAYGYNQQIQLVYDDTGSPDMPTLQKLKILIPQLILNGTQPPANITVNGCTVSFVPYSAPPKNAIDFGFTGGYDDAANLATNLAAKYFLVLQPFQWPKSNYIARNGGTNFSLDNMPNIDPAFRQRAFYAPDPTLSDAEWDLYLDQSAAPIESANLIYSFAAQTVQGEQPINLCGAYGMTNIHNGITTLATTPEDLLFNLTCGIIKHIDDTGDTKPTVIVVLASVTPESYTKLGNYFQGNDFENNQYARTFLTTHKVMPVVGNNPRITVMPDGSNTNALLTAIDGMKAGQVLIVGLPGLPPDVFNQMMYASTLPVVFEGKNTANQAVNFPSSFFWLSKGDGDAVTVVYPTLLSAARGITATHYQKITNTMKNSPDMWTALNLPGNILGDFITNTIATKGNNYFSELSDYYHLQLNDKLFKAMQVFLAIHV
ncbi:MAG: hypothetical protein PSV16_04940 [Flavobacterium sp.]|nr:hypothetical protein [Flavobacterium sp.]